jgi:hypothetical protein
MNKVILLSALHILSNVGNNYDTKASPPIKTSFLVKEALDKVTLVALSTG